MLNITRKKELIFVVALQILEYLLAYLYLAPHYMLYDKRAHTFHRNTECINVLL